MKALGIILAGGNSSRMQQLTEKRAIAAMPVGGSYRCIDFVLSNMTNSHIQTVAVLSQYNARSLNEHLNSSKWWNFGRKQGGLFLFTPTVTTNNSWWYRGTADAIWQNIDFLKKRHEPYVIIASGDCVYKLDFNKVLDYHIQKQADITVVCAKLPEGDEGIKLVTEGIKEVIGIEIKNPKLIETFFDDEYPCRTGIRSKRRQNNKTFLCFVQEQLRCSLKNRLLKNLFAETLRLLALFLFPRKMCFDCVVFRTAPGRSHHYAACPFYCSFFFGGL